MMPPKLIAGLMGTSVTHGSPSLHLPSLLTLLSSHNISRLDTARVYNSGKSEQDFGNISSQELRDGFEIHTKAPGFSPSSLSYEKVMGNCEKSLKALGREKVELFYFHGPDRQTPLEESCRAINDLHQRGKIARFGISNFNVDEVKEIIRICIENSWILPTVYQGGYNPLARTAETTLFPTLRQHHIAFYAYSPLAGGFFSRPTEELRHPPKGGRMDQMAVFQKMYVNDLTLELHDTLSASCEEEGLKLKEATLRFLMHHSALGEEDGVILGASSKEQMEENLRACEAGPLPGSVVDAFEKIWVEYRKGGYDPPYCV